jgi:hypothetical protein
MTRINTLSKLPPAFDDLQKVSDTDMMDILASKAPKGHKELMTDHSFDPQTATTAEFVEICERAETKEALQTRKQSHDSDDDSSDDEVQRPKNPERRRRPLPTTTRERDPNSIAKNTAQMIRTTLVRARSSSTMVEKTIGRRRILPNLSTRTTSRSTRKSMPNSTFSKRKPRRRRPSGQRPTRTLSPKKLTTSRGAKKANQAIAKRIKRPQPKSRLVPTTATRTATAAPIVARPPTPTPNRKAAAGKLIC